MNDLHPFTAAASRAIAAATLSIGTLTVPALTQTVLFEDDFEQGSAAWNLSGEWHEVGPVNPCGSEFIPFPSPDGAMRYGRVNGCSFGFNFLSGNMDTASPIDLPAGSTRITLSFWSYERTECGSGKGCGWDWKFLYLSADGGATWDFLGECSSEGLWYQKTFDLTEWQGQTVLLRFHFDAVDHFFNEWPGWVVDDVRVVADPCASSNYCIASPNSFSPGGATMSHSGSKRIHQDSFGLVVDDAPPGQFAHFFYGPSTAQVPIADGFLCVGLGATGITRLFPSGMIDGQGHLERAFDFAASASTDNAVTPGSTWNFQCWFRDPSGGPNGSNFSDAIAVTFCP